MKFLDLYQKALDLDDLFEETLEVKGTEKSKEIKEQEKSSSEAKTEEREQIIDNRLIIGQNEKRNDLFIADNSRFLNMAIIGAKGTGKTTSLLPFFAEQDISKKLSGSTFIVSDKEMAYNLYSLCKKYKKKVHLLKPSINNEISNKFLWMNEYNYDYINEKIINYKEVIRRKEIVIIDMEVFKYKLDAIRATSMLLLQLRLDLQDTDITQRHNHFLYVDDAFYYMKFLEDLLMYGSTYNLGVILFLESRTQLMSLDKDYRSIFDNNIRNILLLNKISNDDYDFYKRMFSDKLFENIFNREKTSIVYQTVDIKGSIRNGISKLKPMNNSDLKEIERISKKIRTGLLKEKRKMRENEIRARMNDAQYTNEPKPIDEKLLESLVNETEYMSNEKKKNVEEIEEKIKEKIKEEEKTTKRKLAENIFNNYNKNIEFCDDLFKFD